MDLQGGLDARDGPRRARGGAPRTKTCGVSHHQSASSPERARFTTRSRRSMRTSCTSATAAMVPYARNSKGSTTYAHWLDRLAKWTWDTKVQCRSSLPDALECMASARALPRSELVSC